MRGFCWWSIRNTCPIQRHLRLLIYSLMVQVLALRPASSLVTLIDQYTFNTLRRHLWRNVSSFTSSLLVALQVSHPQSSTAMMLDLKILILVFLLSWPLLQILASLLNAAVAFPKRRLMSSSAPPCLVTLAPRQSKPSTSSISCPSTTTALLFFTSILMCLVFLVLIFRSVPFPSSSGCVWNLIHLVVFNLVCFLI